MMTTSNSPWLLRQEQKAPSEELKYPQHILAVRGGVNWKNEMQHTKSKISFLNRLITFLELMYLIPATLSTFFHIRARGTRYSHSILGVKSHEGGDFDFSGCLLKWCELALGMCCEQLTAQSQEQWSREAEGAYTVLPQRLVCKKELMHPYWQSRTISTE